MKKQDKNQLDIFDKGYFFRIDVNVGAAREALAAFAKDRASALEKLSQDVRSAVALGINDLLNAEMSLFLGQPDQKDNKRNGYRRREYYLKGIGCLRLDVPRDRNGSFESLVVPKHERIDASLRKDMAVLYLAGISNRTLSMLSKHLLGVSVSKDTIASSVGLLRDAADKWLTRPLTEDYWALYIDGTNFKVQRRGSTEREPSLVVLGVNSNNYRSVLAVEPGYKDNVESWRSVFRSLKGRGLKAESVRIGVMDGLPGLEKLFQEEFPKAVTQRCWIHAKRNALAKCPARYREAFSEMLTKVMYAPSDSAARQLFDDLKTAMGTEAQRATRCIEKDLTSLLQHYRFEEKYWGALKTTNAIERVNKEFKRRTKSMDSMGEGTLMTVVAFTSLKLEMGWRLHSIDSKVFSNFPKTKESTSLVEKTIDAMEKVVH